jgi:DHA3 family macrolide efflux protein-like MFS transporter
MGLPEGNPVPPSQTETPASGQPSPPSPGNTIRVGIPSPGPSFRGALKSRDFALLWTGQFGSEVGNGLVQLALPLLIYDLTDSGFQLALAYVVQFAPWLMFGLLGGVLVDRWDRRLTIITVESVRAVAFLAAGLAYAIDSSFLSVEVFYALIFLESSLQNFFNPARLALLPHLVKDDDLRAANSLMEVSRHFGFLVAPPAGVALASVLGNGTILLADAVTFMFSGLTVFLIKWRQPPRVFEPVDGWSSRVDLVVSETREGFGVIRRVKLLQVTLLLGFSLNLVVAPIQGLLPIYVRVVKDQPNAYYGLLAAGFVTGLILGSLLAPQVSRRTGLGHMTVGSVVVLGATICVAAYVPTLLAPVAAMFIAGTAIGSLNVGQINMLQTSTTDDERGRVSATYYTATLGVRSLGYLTAGALAAPAGVQPLFVAFGLIVLGVGIYIWRIPEVREHV